MSALETIIKNEILHNGPMDIGHYMNLCLGHPQHGYYITRDPFGKTGDFVTAPEVSQMFGEMIGAWIIDTWQKLGAPSSFTLLECGAGRGTLMSDIMRVAKSVSDFTNAVQIKLLETSPVLIKKQQEALSAYSPKWYGSLSEVDLNDPLIVIGNEFLDALPIRQFRKDNNQLKEVVIGVDEDKKLSLGLSNQPSDIDAPLNMKEGEILELAPIRNQFMKTVLDMLKKNRGAGLFIDYGYNQSFGDTLQAIKDHKFIPVTDHVGDADITSHVDFLSLRKLCKQEGVHEYGLVKQADFLKSLGIVTRAQILKQKATSAQSGKIEKDLNRLVGLDEMGKIFKVMAFSSEPLPLAGFSI